MLSDIAFGIMSFMPKGLLKAQAVVVLNTSNTPAAREADVFGDPLQALWKDCIFDVCGCIHLLARCTA